MQPMYRLDEPARLVVFKKWVTVEIRESFFSGHRPMVARWDTGFV